MAFRKFKRAVKRTPETPEIGSLLNNQFVNNDFNVVADRFSQFGFRSEKLLLAVNPDTIMPFFQNIPENLRYSLCGRERSAPISGLTAVEGIQDISENILSIDLSTEVRRKDNAPFDFRGEVQ